MDRMRAQLLAGDKRADDLARQLQACSVELAHTREREQRVSGLLQTSESQCAALTASLAESQEKALKEASEYSKKVETAPKQAESVRLHEAEAWETTRSAMEMAAAKLSEELSQERVKCAETVETISRELLEANSENATLRSTLESSNANAEYISVQNAEMEKKMHDLETMVEKMQGETCAVAGKLDAAIEERDSYAAEASRLQAELETAREMCEGAVADADVRINEINESMNENGMSGHWRDRSSLRRAKDFELSSALWVKLMVLPSCSFSSSR